MIVADEPVSNLDASVRGEILQLLMRLRDELGLSIIIVTHDLGLAWTVADRVAVMYLGRIVEIGPRRGRAPRPLHPYTKALLDVVPEAGGIERPILQGEPPDPTRIPSGAGSIRVVPWWRRAARASWASRSAARARTWRSRARTRARSGVLGTKLGEPAPGAARRSLRPIG